MCLAVPGKIIEIKGNEAVVDYDIEKRMALLIEKKLKHKLKVYLMYAIAGIIIASPLPDEAGIIMLAGLTKIKMHNLAILSFLFNTLGIIIILFI